MSGDEFKIDPRPWATVPSFVEAVDLILGEETQPISSLSSNTPKSEVASA